MSQILNCLTHIAYEKDALYMKKILQHIQMHVFRGLIAIIPILLCVTAISFLYIFIDKNIINFIARFYEIRHIPGVGVLILIVSLYLVGLITTNILGRQLFRFIERISKRIPLIKAIYSVGKQLSKSLQIAGEQKQSLKKAILVKIEGAWVPAFVMSTMTHAITKEEYLTVLVSTAPTPAGFVIVVKAADAIDPGWSVEECLKIVVSMGLVCPKEINKI